MSKHICVIAGEPSGDFLGGKLIAALKAVEPDARFSGVGGHHMAAAGLVSLFSYQQLAVMGIAEVLPKLPTLLARIRQTINHIKEAKPDVVVTIDSPDFSFRVLKAVRKMENPPKLIHYVAPTVWAWREGRAAKIAKFLDGLICLFDFEPPYFEKVGLKAVAVGHPLVEGDALPVRRHAHHIVLAAWPVPQRHQRRPQRQRQRRAHREPERRAPGQPRRQRPQRLLHRRPRPATALAAAARRGRLHDARAKTEKK